MSAVNILTQERLATHLAMTTPLVARTAQHLITTNDLTYQYLITWLQGCLELLQMYANENASCAL